MALQKTTEKKLSEIFNFLTNEGEHDVAKLVTEILRAECKVKRGTKFSMLDFADKTGRRLYEGVFYDNGSQVATDGRQIMVFKEEYDPELEGNVDFALVDVPCSGYGIIRKKPDIRYKNLKEMAKLPELQLQILKNQARYVKPGGALLYSTCTLTHGENEGLVAEFLKDNLDFTLEPLNLPDVFPKNESGMLALVPGEHDTDGFFIAKLRRKA